MYSARPLSRRTLITRWGLAATGLVASGVLAACSASSTTSSVQTSSTASTPASTTALSTVASKPASAKSIPKATPTPPPQSQGKGTVVFDLPGLNLQQQAIFRGIVDSFTKSTDIKVELVNTGLNFEKFAVQFAADSGGDLYEYELKQVPHYATLGVFVNLDPYVAKSKIVQPGKYFAVTWDKGTIQGHQYAIPWDTTPVATYYNKDLLHQAGLEPPSTAWGDSKWDWNAFLSYAQKLTRPDKTAFGCDISTWWVYSLPWIWSNGGHVVNEALTKVQFTEQAVQDAWQWLVDLRWKYNVWAQPAQKHAGFDTGGVAMFLSGPYSIPNLRKSAKVPWDVVPVPTGKIGVWTRDPADSVTIWTGSKNKDEAFQLAEYITGPEGQLAIGKGGRGVPARKSVATSKAFLDQGDGISWKVFADGPDHEGLQPVTDVWPQMDSEIGKVLGPMWNNNADVPSTMTKLDEVIQPLLDHAKVRRDLSGSYLPQGWKSPAY
ncbi:MAG: sugar ABC transporter substrate-binding protein [Chloroflexi bacterium]|nr:sugar ABC transporter substrate-binding protein [Chloroflexota bacterium]